PPRVIGDLTIVFQFDGDRVLLAVARDNLAVVAHLGSVYLAVVVVPDDVTRIVRAREHAFGLRHVRPVHINRRSVILRLDYSFPLTLAANHRVERPALLIRRRDDQRALPRGAIVGGHRPEPSPIVGELPNSPLLDQIPDRVPDFSV